MIANPPTKQPTTEISELQEFELEYQIRLKHPTSMDKKCSEVT
jgi:hypothetical protein